MTVYTTKHFKVGRVIICGNSRYLITKIGEKDFHQYVRSEKQAIAICNMFSKLCNK